MGLFVLDLSKPKTKKSLTETAIANLELYLTESKNGEDDSYDYLLDIASGFIARAKDKDFE